NKVYLSKGLQLIDALSSGPIAALENSPVVLANNDLTATQRSILSKRSTNVIVQAGYGISSNVTESLRDLL
ncbi:cell wall-binding repeat-containing protein, partial [Escherichia coli]